MYEELQKPIEFSGRLIKNRVVFQPMEGCDCNKDGSPSEYTLNKYRSFATSHAGIIWAEANAVCEEGRTGERQMMLTKSNLSVFRDFVSEIKSIAQNISGFTPLMLIQLTHSGRQSIRPLIAYRNAVYEKTRPVTDDNVVTDDYLDALPDRFAESARLAELAGFDGVDMKSCHGYLLQELLSAYERSGKYGGSFENRSRLYFDCVKAIKSKVSPDFIIASRFGVTDAVKKPYGFGTDENNNIDLTESKKMIERMRDCGIRLVNITLGNPYYNPHVNRPFRKGPYIPDEAPEVGLKRFRDVQKELKSVFPDMVFVGSGLSYYKEKMLDAANDMIKDGVCDLAGFGRQTLAYPSFYADALKREFDGKKCCLACSKCTELMRNKSVAGCAVFNPTYRDLYKSVCINKAK